MYSGRGLLQNLYPRGKGINECPLMLQSEEIEIMDLEHKQRNSLIPTVAQQPIEVQKEPTSNSAFYCHWKPDAPGRVGPNAITGGSIAHNPVVLLIVAYRKN